MAADRRRYSRRKSSEPAKLSRNTKDWNTCTIIDVSLVGFGLRTDKRFATRPGNLVWLRVDGYDPIPCFVAWRSHEAEGTRLGLRAQEFVDNYRTTELHDSRERLHGRYIIKRDVKNEIDWGNLVAYLEKSDELIASVRDLILVVDQAIDSNVDLPRSVLNYIQFGSPGAAEIKIDFGIADVLKVLIEFVQHFGLQRKRYRVETEGMELDNQRKSLENTQLQIEVTRNALNLNREALNLGADPAFLRQILGPPLARALHVDLLPESIFEDNSLEKGIFEERILPALAEVTNGDDPAFKMSIES